MLGRRVVERPAAQRDVVVSKKADVAARVAQWRG